jgi:hypothetical protein
VRHRAGLLVLGSATLSTGLVLVLAMAVLATLLDVRVRASRIRRRDQRGLLPLLKAIRSSTPPTRPRTADDPLDVWAVAAPGLGSVVLVRGARGEGAIVYEGAPERAARVWSESEARARGWAEREAARIRECGGFVEMLAASGLDARASAVIAATEPASRAPP